MANIKEKMQQECIEFEFNSGNYNIKNTTIFIIGEFSILWNMFEGSILNQHCDIPKIISLAEKITPNKGNHCKPSCYAAFEKFAKVLNTRVTIMENCKSVDTDKYVNAYVRAKIFPNEDARKRAEKKGKEHDINIFGQIVNFISSSGKFNYDGALFAIWAIRNNMFHGSKGYDSLNEQTELFEAMNELLHELLCGINI